MRPLFTQKTIIRDTPFHFQKNNEVALPWPEHWRIRNEKRMKTLALGATAPKQITYVQITQKHRLAQRDPN